MRPQNMEIFPNPVMQENPVISEIIPYQGHANQPLWICGSNFSPETIRVSVGNSQAVVYSCDSKLIKCIVPPLKNGVKAKCSIQVANGNVFTTASTVFTYA